MNVHRLSIREKREFYSGLARLIRSGSALPTALELLARDTPRGLGDFLRSLNARIQTGEPIGDALLHQRPRVTALEASIVTAASRGGRLDQGCDHLARYFDALERSRNEMTSRMIYPLVMLHLTILILKLGNLVNGGAFNPAHYLASILPPLAVLYGALAAIWLLWQGLTEAARHNVLADRLVTLIPGVGPIREKFALARFFATLDAQLEASVNIWDAFTNAAQTTDSARFITAAREALPLLKNGERLSEAIAAKKVIPAQYVRSFRVAEQAGELDAELNLMARGSEELAVAALVRWSEWLPRILYTGVLGYAAWQIVLWYDGYIQTINSFGTLN
jgi:type II secretory pathway component PulF